MKYMGSKRRLAKHLLPIILKDRRPGQLYVEPFVGGGNMFERVENPRIGSDVDEYAIAALTLIRDHVDELPKKTLPGMEDIYINMRNHPRMFDRGQVGYWGYALSYGGKWFGGWRRDSEGRRDYVAEAYRGAVRQSPLLHGASLRHTPYQDGYINLAPSIIYCDPPYANTTSYSTEFNHPQFWEWCRKMSELGHTVFVSEYEAPSDFRIVWEGRISSSLTKDTGSKAGVERLFTWSD